MCRWTINWCNQAIGHYYLMTHLQLFLKKNAQTVGIEPDPGLVRYGGSTDMGNVSHIIPSIHPKFNIGTMSHQHTRDFAATAGKSLVVSIANFDYITIIKTK